MIGWKGGGPRGCWMNLVDDATGTRLCRLGEQETIWAAVGVLNAWIEKYGVPRALYTDWKTFYVGEPTQQEVWRGRPAVTQLGRLCERESKSSRPVRRGPRAERSGITARIRTGW